MIRKVITAVLLLFVAGSIVFLVASETRRTSDAAAPPQPTTLTGPSSQHGSTAENTPPVPADAPRAETVVYYFHGAMRCPTCLKMEHYAREAVEEAFGAEIESGLMAWQALNYDEPPNEHFVHEYGLTASAIVVVSRAQASAATWRNLDRIWDLVGDESAFKAYVVETVTAARRGDS
jgi:hypothetical protein